VKSPRREFTRRGKLHLFSIDTLVGLLSAAGLRVKVKVRKGRGSAGRVSRGGPTACK
jgi:hypothetical protein